MKFSVWVIDGNNMFLRNYHKLKSMNFGGVYGFVKFMFSHRDRISEPDMAIVVWDGGRSKRRMEIYPEYKAGRKRMDSVEYLDMTTQRDICKSQVCDTLGIISIILKGYEADDIIATISEFMSNKGIDVTLISGDQDFYQLMKYENVRVWNPAKNEYVNKADLEVIPRYYAWFKSITGDTSDNIKGIKGIGKVRGAQYINTSDIKGGELRARKIFNKIIKLRNIVGEGSLLVERNLKLVDFDKIPEKDRKHIKQIFKDKVEEWGKNLDFWDERKINYLSLCRDYKFRSLVGESLNERFFKIVYNY